jgi:hypothetical protein
VAWAGLLLWVGIVEVRRADLVRDDRAHPAAADELIAAWRRSREATFTTRGTYERRSSVTGAAITSEDVVSQRPPRRIHRQLGGVDGRDDDRLIVCPAAPPEADEPAPCRLGAPGGLTYAESTEREVLGLRSILLTTDPLYTVTASEPGCFHLEQRRIDPRAPFGLEATFCFDDATGAPTRRRVRYEGEVEERLVVTTVDPDVSDEDLEP